MKTIIEGYAVDNFGSNNYSYGMEAIVFNHKEVTVKEVEKLPNIFLHPICKPNSLEIFALLGTQEQFAKFYKSAVSSYAAKAAFDKYGMPENEDRGTWNLIHSYVEDVEADFVPWYTYYPEPIH